MSGVPGSNLLLEALELIESQPVNHYRFIDNTRTAAGILIPNFEQAQFINIGSVQAIPHERYQLLGLDLERNYVNWYVPRAVIGLQRDYAGDQIEWYGDRYQLQTLTDWFGQDGWVQATCVKVSNPNA